MLPNKAESGGRRADLLPNARRDESCSCYGMMEVRSGRCDPKSGRHRENLLQDRHGTVSCVAGRARRPDERAGEVNDEGRAGRS